VNELIGLGWIGIELVEKGWIGIELVEKEYVEKGFCGLWLSFWMFGCRVVIG